MRVLVACEFSGVVRDAFDTLGHDAWSCDLEPTEKPGKHFQGDVFDVLDSVHDWDLVIAHPPCTYLCVSGNRWFNDEYKTRFPERHKQREDALNFVRKFFDLKIRKLVIENPVSVISTRIEKPTQIIQPYEYGDPERKTTCLWLRGVPKLKPTNIVTPQIYITRTGNTYSSYHGKTFKLPKEERAKERSRTFPGIANAMAYQWGGVCL